MDVMSLCLQCEHPDVRKKNLMSLCRCSHKLFVVISFMSLCRWCELELRERRFLAQDFFYSV